MDIIKLKKLVKSKLQSESSGHDYLHALRVYENAMSLYEEGMDKDVIISASLIHDLIDHKLEDEYTLSLDELKVFLSTMSLTEKQIEHVIHIIENISFSKGNVPSTQEGKIVQDADRLDALGAIGIARTFSFGGKFGRLIYGDKDKQDSVSHFYDKLLKLGDLMNTKQGKEEAEKRIAFMKQYLEQLYKEIGEMK